MSIESILDQGLNPAVLDQATSCHDRQCPHVFLNLPQRNNMEGKTHENQQRVCAAVVVEKDLLYSPQAGLELMIRLSSPPS